jgi:hypothetical protein
MDMPEALYKTESLTWVLLVPDSESQKVLTWQDIMVDTSPSGDESTLFIEWTISEVIPFANDETSSQASVQALIDTLNTRYDPDTGAGLWVDSLLMEETDEQGTKSWVLHTSSGRPAGPAPEDWVETFCCWWRGCDQSTGEDAICDSALCRDRCD